MNVKFYGVRGSIPACGKEFQVYGGNTTCIRIFRETVNRLVIFDAGTGIRNLGKDIIAQGIHQSVINIIFSHFHWDHIQGLPFFAPAYNKEQQIGILVMGKERKYKDLKEIFSLPMQMEYFPVELQSMGAQFEFLSLGDTETFYGATVTAVPQHHTLLSGSYGFRIQDESGSLVICTDLEHLNGLDDGIVTLAKDADLLIHDGQYTPAEYERYKGWGHSSWEQAVEVAIKANVKKLIITHHDPDHDDAFLEMMEKECQKAFPNSCFAKEGMEVMV
ncbi:MAG TPA: MBL fold metallo-hydrolase [Chitinophagaceae bacterium]|nr:MBL fold metallo-hydrolase [Chitinophagaceae bacterium]